MNEISQKNLKGSVVVSPVRKTFQALTVIGSMIRKSKNAGNILLVLFALLLLVFIVAPFYGVLPLGSASSLGILYTVLGNIECLTKMGLCTPCALTGLPIGGYMPLGLSFTYVASAIQLLTGTSVLNAFSLAGLIFLCIGWLGVYKIISVFGGNKFFAFLGGLLFLFMPIVYAKSDYVYMMWAFASVAFYIWLDLWYFQSKRVAISLPVAILSKIFLVFLGPYTFVMASLFTGVIILYEFIKAIRAKKELIKSLLKITGLGLALLIAYIFYSFYIPGGNSYSVMPMNFFRGQGIDLAAFFNRPLEMYAFNQFWNAPISNSKLFYSDGESIYHVYFGLSLMLTIPLLVFFRKQIRPQHWFFIAIGAITLVLSLGPSLKVNNQRDPLEAGTNTDTFVFEDYLMPEQSATATLPHSFIYKITPVKYMRSVSRWLMPTILICVVSLMVLITCLWRYNRFGKILAALLLLGVIFEYSPNYKQRLLKIQGTTSMFNNFNADALAEFKEQIQPGDLILFIQNGGLTNEYLSTYLCSNVGCSSYNVSTDKAVELSLLHWPKVVTDAAMNPDRKTILALLESKQVTAIVFPHFDMRWNSYRWPPAPETKTQFSEFARQFSDESANIAFQTNEWFSYMRLNP
jgi:hypothetical protein